MVTDKQTTLDETITFLKNLIKNQKINCRIFNENNPEIQFQKATQAYSFYNMLNELGITDPFGQPYQYDGQTSLTLTGNDLDILVKELTRIKVEKEFFEYKLEELGIKGVSVETSSKKPVDPQMISAMRKHSSQATSSISEAGIQKISEEFSRADESKVYLPTALQLNIQGAAAIRQMNSLYSALGLKDQNGDQKQVNTDGQTGTSFFIW